MPYPNLNKEFFHNEWLGQIAYWQSVVDYLAQLGLQPDSSQFPFLLEAHFNEEYISVLIEGSRLGLIHLAYTILKVIDFQDESSLNEVVWDDNSLTGGGVSIIVRRVNDTYPNGD